MSWKDNLMAGSFRNVPFVAESADGELGRRWALHEYPMRDKPHVEDMGRKTRRLPLNIYVLGPEYMSGRNALIDAFEAPGPGRLVHPWLGEMTVSAFEVRGPRESTREGGMARFTVTFVESGDNVFPKSSTATAQATEEKAGLAAGALQRSFASAFDADRPEFVFTHAKTLIGKVTEKLDAMRRAAPGVPAAITSYLSDLQQLSTSVEALIRTPADLAVEIYGLIADLALLPDRPERAVRSYRQLWDTLASEPDIAATTASRIRQADNQQALSDLVHRAAVVEAVRTAASMDFDSYDDAVALRDELADRLDAESETADDDTFRALTDLRVALVRDMAARGANLARVVHYTPAATLPALVLAYQLYDDPGRDHEIVSRNRISHPGFVVGGSALEVLTDA